MITAVSRIPNSMELWWIGANGSVQDAFWYEGGNWQRFELAPDGSASSGGGITAVSRIPNSMELWWIGANGSVQDAFWYEGGNWQRFELAPGGSASSGGGITAVSRIPNSMELWWIGANGSVQGAFWYEGGNWQRYELGPVVNPAITLRAVEDQGRFIEVTGIRFTPNQTVKLGYDITSGGAPTHHQIGEDTLTSNDTGSFIHRIPVNQPGDISNAQAQATDVASGATATASIF